MCAGKKFFIGGNGCVKMAAIQPGQPVSQSASQPGQPGQPVSQI